MGTRRPFPILPAYTKVVIDVIQLKAYVKHLETDRILAMLKNLKDDEIRLIKCIDDVEVFHRNMFVLLNTENKTAKHEPENKTAKHEPENKTAKNEPENKTADVKYKFVVNYNPSVTEQDFSRDQLECSVVDIEDSMNQSECFVIKTDDSVNQPEPSVNEPDYSVNQPESSVFQPDYSMNQSESFPLEELPVGIYEKIDSPEDELEDSKDKSYDMQDKSDDIKENSTIDQKEMVEKAVLDLLADGEREISKLVLDLILRFSGFQRRLQETETKVSRLKTSYNESIDNVKSMLKRLSWSVLYLDNTVSKIYTKYLEMLKNISSRKDV